MPVRWHIRPDYPLPPYPTAVEERQKGLAALGGAMGDEKRGAVRFLADFSTG